MSMFKKSLQLEDVHFRISQAYAQCNLEAKRNHVLQDQMGGRQKGRSEPPTPLIRQETCFLFFRDLMEGGLYSAKVR